MALISCKEYDRFMQCKTVTRSTQNPPVIQGGVVHRVPADLREVLLRDATMLSAWQSCTPLARNEWICWITSPKLAETRARRIRIAHSQLTQGKRRPCCWPGCPHR
jgi:hypothetical protein